VARLDAHEELLGDEAGRRLREDLLQHAGRDLAAASAAVAELGEPDLHIHRDAFLSDSVRRDSTARLTPARSPRARAPRGAPAPGRRAPGGPGKPRCASEHTPASRAL